MLYVTHDQSEAMTLADQIVLLNEGSISQVGKPLDLYNKPKNIFVGTFIGSPNMNLIKAHIFGKSVDIFNIEINETVEEISIQSGLNLKPGEEVTLGIRPENLIVNGTTEICWESRVELVERLGSESLVYLSQSDHPLIAQINCQTSIQSGDMVKVGFHLNACSIFK